MELFTEILRTGVVTEALPDRAPRAVMLAHEVDHRTRALFGRALRQRSLKASTRGMRVAGDDGRIGGCQRDSGSSVANQ